MLPFRCFSAKPSLTDEPARDPVFAKYYVVESEEHGLAQTKTLSGLIGWEAERLGMNWLFYVGAALSLPLILGVLLCVKLRQLWIVLGATVTTGLAVALCSFTQVHYFAPATVAVYVFVVEGLRYLWEQHGMGERAFTIAVVITVVVVSLARQSASVCYGCHVSNSRIRGP